MTANVRPRTPADLAPLAAVLRHVHATDGYPVEGVDDPQTWLEPNNELASWTAHSEAQVVGQISVVAAQQSDDAAALWLDTTQGDIATIVIPVRLFIDPAHRNEGHASRLMLAAHSYATDHGQLLVFDVMEKDQNAIRLYANMGCTRIGSTQHDDGGGSLHPAAVFVAPVDLVQR